MEFIEPEPQEFESVVLPIKEEKPLEFKITEYVIPKETFDVEEVEDEHDAICVKGTELSNTINYTDGNFKILNLFSELLTDYQKMVARENLGIADAYVLKWGNITGTLGDQTDLTNYINEQYTSAKQYLEKHIDTEIANINISDITDQATVYYGDSPTNLTLSTKKTFTTGDYQYIYVAIPDTSKQLSVNGVSGGFTYQGVTSLNGEVFYLYRSDNANLGVTTITYG